MIRKDTVFVVTSCDKNYVLALFVLGKSLLKTFSKDKNIVFFILAHNISQENKNFLLNSWLDSRMQVRFIDIDNKEILVHFPQSLHLNYMVYARIFIDRFLPKDLKKVIYLDCDTMLLNDICKLWNYPMYNYPILAIQDLAAPFFNTKLSVKDKSINVLVNNPIPNYKKLGLNPKSKYFNSGVMVIDLEFWRKNKVELSLCRIIKDNYDSVLFCDQYAFNVYFANKWKPVDLRWNQTYYVHSINEDKYPLFSAFVLRRLKKFPWIVHFNTENKPWLSRTKHPQKILFLQNANGFVLNNRRLFSKSRIIGRLWAIFFIFKDLKYVLKTEQLLFELATFLFSGHSQNLQYVYVFYSLIFFTDADHFKWTLKEVFFQQIYNCHLNNLKNPVVIDIGANVGTSIIYFKKISPNTKIFAFEPNETACTALYQNLLANNINNVEVNHCAVVSSRYLKKTVTFYQSPISSCSSTKQEYLDSRFSFQKTLVPTININDIFMAHKNIDLLKIDIEGGEYDLIQDIVDFSNNIRHMIIEFHNVERPCFYKAMFHLSNYFDISIGDYPLQINSFFNRPFLFGNMMFYFSRKANLKKIRPANL